MATGSLKLGDKVSAQYRGATAVGIIDGFAGGWVMLKLTQPLDLGFRVETDSVGIDPGSRHTVTLIEAGPALTWDDVHTMPAACGGGQWLKNPVVVSSKEVA